MPSSRRAFLRDLAGIASSALAVPALERIANAAPQRARPRALVQLWAYGGIDAVWTTDPKVRGEVDPTIEVPYEPSAIQSFGAVRVGAHFARLGPHLSKFAILNGVRCGTVAHPTGGLQTAQMRRLFPSVRSPGLAQTIGTVLRRDAPLSCVHSMVGQLVNTNWEPPSGRVLVANYGAGDPDESVFKQLMRLRADSAQWPLVLREAGELVNRCGAAPKCASLEATRDLLRSLPSELPSTWTLPANPHAADLPPAARKAHTRFMGRAWPAIFRDVLFVLANRIAPTLFVRVPGSWDTHSNNTQSQALHSYDFVSALNQFLGDLETTRSPEGGRLSDEVGVVISSELGRFPILNEWQGKDHFPEHPMMFLGPGIKPGVYGRTDAKMVGTPISPATGRPAASSRDFVPTIDDVGATMLDWFGIEDTAALGYFGRRLDFLLA